MIIKLVENIISEKPQKNDKLFAGDLGLNMYQEQHYMTADIDKPGTRIG